MAEKLFGTDGVRGKANRHPITPEMTVKIGQAVAAYFAGSPGAQTSGQGAPYIAIGKDTRISGDMIECAAAAGICSAGCGALLLGIIPTPGLAHAIPENKCAAGIMISASHNPFEDNGIKVFDRRGFKLPDPIERELELLVFQPPAPAPGVGRVAALDGAGAAYAAFLQRALPGSRPLAGISIALDCSNGAAFSVAPRVFENLGASVIPLFVQPDGLNINVNCGSQHPQTLQETVIRNKAHLGLAFDGDGDRVIAVDEKGARVSGDQILAVCARHLKETGRLAANTVVSTVMSNLGFKQAMERLDIRHEIADVGDRYVLDAMQAAGAILGGEDSGHVIFLNHHTTGDGILSGLQLIAAMLHHGQPLSQLAQVMQVFPQVLVNVPVASKPDLAQVEPLSKAIQTEKQALEGRGRILVRYSGTRPVCRVMVEGPTREATQEAADRIAEVVRRHLG